MHAAARVATREQQQQWQWQDPDARDYAQWFAALRARHHIEPWLCDAVHSMMRALPRAPFRADRYARYLSTVACVRLVCKYCYDYLCGKDLACMDHATHAADKLDWRRHEFCVLRALGYSLARHIPLAPPTPPPPPPPTRAPAPIRRATPARARVVPRAPFVREPMSLLAPFVQKVKRNFMYY